jgi:hypothetical protein
LELQYIFVGVGIKKEVRNPNPASQQGDKTQVVSFSYINMAETWSIEVTSKRTY